MSTAVYEELFRFLTTKTEEPEVQARQKLFGKLYFDMHPELKAEVAAELKAEVAAELKAEVAAELKAEVAAEARVAEARSALRRVLARRKLVLSAEEEARIDACADLTTLERWHDQAVESQSAAEALQ